VQNNTVYFTVMTVGICFLLFFVFLTQLSSIVKIFSLLFRLCVCFFCVYATFAVNKDSQNAVQSKLASFYITLHQCSNCSKIARGPRAVQAVESRHVWGMWCREGTLLDPTVGGDSTLLPPNFKFLISKRPIFCRLLSAKLKIFIYNQKLLKYMHGGWRRTCDNKQTINCQ